MWLENLLEFRETNKQHLNFKIELHLAIYIMKILKDRIEFKLTKHKTKESLSIHLYDEDKDLFNQLEKIGSNNYGTNSSGKKCNSRFLG